MASIYADGSRGHHRFTLTVTESYVSGGAENYSNVSFSFVLSALGGGWDWRWAASSKPVWYTITIAGEKYTGKITQYDGHSSVTVYTGSKRITHDGDGKKTISFGFSVDSLNYNYLPGSASATGTMALTTIPRYASINQVLAARTETSISMNFTTDAVIDKAWYSIDNGTTWTEEIIAEGRSGGYTVSGLTVETAYNVKTKVRRKDSGLTSESAAQEVSTYPYPHGDAMPDFVVGSDVSVGIFNPLGHTITVEMVGDDDSVISTDTITGTSVSGFNAAAKVTALYNSIPNAASATYRIRVTYGENISTVSGGVYSADPAKCFPSPILMGYESSTSIPGVTISKDKVVQNRSFVQYGTNAIARNGASIVNATVNVNGAVIPLSYNSVDEQWKNASLTGTEIDSSSDVEAVFTVTDSRGFQRARSITVTMIPWSIPSAIVTMGRQNNFYTETDINVDCDYSSVDGENDVTIDLYYKKVSDQSWTSGGTLQDGVTSTFNADNLYEWDVKVIVSDKLGGTVTYLLFLPVGMPIVYFDRLLLSTGFNCFPKGKKSVEINGFPINKQMTTASLSASATNLDDTDYTGIILDQSVSVGDELTLNVNGGVEIGEGISKVKVSGIVTFSSVMATESKTAAIVKNSYSAANVMAYSVLSLSVGDQGSIVIPPTLVDVQQRDEIFLMYRVNSQMDVIGQASLTVEMEA